MPTVTVIGSGYVGLTTAACLAELGHRVRATDRDEGRIERLAGGHCPIVEESLPNLIEKGLQTGRLSFSTDNSDAVRQSEFVFLCLPTPQGADGTADLSAVMSVAAEIRPALKCDAVLVMKSTVPIGTSRRVGQILGETRVRYVSNPEFFREGMAVDDFFNPDRIVIGADDANAQLLVSELYRGIECPRVMTDCTSAETIKYASNAFLATKISFINDISQICDLADADIDAVSDGMGFDARIGSSFLKPGPGWGGSCFPKDSQALVATSRSLGFRFALLESAIQSNLDHQQRVVHKVLDQLSGSSNVQVAVWGLTFKAGTDDLRDSPALAIALDLASKGIEVAAFDPAVSHNAQLPIWGMLKRCTSVHETLSGSSAVVVLTEWPEFRQVDPISVAGSMTSGSIVDARNILDAEKWRSAGFDYVGIGRK